MAEEETVLQQAQKSVLAALREAGNNLQKEDDLIFEGTKFVLPKNLENNVSGAISFLQAHQAQQEEVHQFSRTFKYRPFDGAYALQQVLKEITGATGHGSTIHTFFGDIPPELTTIDIGVNETTQVPFGMLDIPSLRGKMYSTGIRDKEYGQLYHLVIEAPRKFRGEVEGLFRAVEEYLATHSIYKGKVINGAETPGFVDISKVDTSKIVYNGDTYDQLNANIWSVLRHGNTMKQHGLQLKRAVLLEGPFGTGKTLAAYLTAQEAVQAGWTFILCRPNQDDLNQTMQTALLYAPSVVFFEDIDVIARAGDPEAVSKLLDSFDGVAAKGQDCMAVLTTNHVEEIHKGMLRPGRLDAVIHFGALDRFAFEQLIQAKLPDHLRGDIDYDVVAVAFDGFLPAFATEAIERSLRYSIARNSGVPAPITTSDLVLAADGLRNQLELMDGSKTRIEANPLDRALSDVLGKVINGTKVVDDGYVNGTLEIVPIS